MRFGDAGVDDLGVLGAARRRVGVAEILADRRRKVADVGVVHAADVVGHVRDAARRQEGEEGEEGEGRRGRGRVGGRATG